jgi:hypothetical protein
LCSVEQFGTFQVLLPPRYAIIFYCRRPAAMLHARYWNLFGRSLDALLSLALLAAGWLAATSLAPACPLVVFFFSFRSDEL